MNKNKNFKLFGILFFLALLTRWPAFFVDYYNIDEITNSLYATFIVKGQMPLMDFLGNPYFLTHYFNTVLQYLAGPYSLKVVHAVHIVWVSLTAYFLSLCQRKIKTEAPELVSGVLYLIFSTCFFSKDFRGVLSESLSLLPAVIGAYFVFSWLENRKLRQAFAAGSFIAVASMFKAPAGIEIVAVGAVMILSRGTLHFFVSVLGMFFVFALPILLSGDPVQGLLSTKATLTRIDSQYVGAYTHLPFLYWFGKFIVRTLIVALAIMPLWIWTLGAMRQGFLDADAGRNRRVNLIFLLLWLLGTWFVVSLGKRVFFHYFVFMFPPLCLMASLYVRDWTFALWKQFFFHPLTVVKKSFSKSSLIEGTAVIMGVLSFLTFMADGLWRWSLSDTGSFRNVSEYIKKSTRPDETIFVWGLLPQIYYFSEREPASSMFWADKLVNFSPGTPAMEYVRANGGSLKVLDSITRDMTRGTVTPRQDEPDTNKELSSIGDRELFLFEEMVEKIESAHWRKFMTDVMKRPPTYWVDVSPTGIRSFDAYPFQNYEILRRFVKDNYELETTIDGIILYRLTKRPKAPLSYQSTHQFSIIGTMSCQNSFKFTVCQKDGE